MSIRHVCVTVSKLRSMQNLKLNKKKIITRLCKHTHEKPGYSYCTYMVPPVSITAGLTTCLASTHKQKKAKVNIVLSALSWAINCKVYSNRGHQTFCLPDAILWTLACDVCKRIWTVGLFTTWIDVYTDAMRVERVKIKVPWHAELYWFHLRIL